MLVVPIRVKKAVVIPLRVFFFKISDEHPPSFLYGSAPEPKTAASKS